MLYLQFILWSMVRWPIRGSKLLKPVKTMLNVSAVTIAELDASQRGTQQCAHLRNTHKKIFSQTLWSVCVTKELCFHSVPLQAVCRMWCAFMLWRQSTWWCWIWHTHWSHTLNLQIGRQQLWFFFFTLHCTAQSIHCKPSSSSYRSSGWCSSSIRELVEKGDDQMQPVKS